LGGVASSPLVIEVDDEKMTVVKEAWIERMVGNKAAILFFNKYYFLVPIDKFMRKLYAESKFSYI
jgi:hypothetical protein